MWRLMHCINLVTSGFCTLCYVMIHGELWPCAIKRVNVKHIFEM